MLSSLNDIDIPWFLWGIAVSLNVAWASATIDAPQQLLFSHFHVLYLSVVEGPSVALTPVRFSPIFRIHSSSNSFVVRLACQWLKILKWNFLLNKKRLSHLFLLAKKCMVILLKIRKYYCQVMVGSWGFSYNTMVSRLSCIEITYVSGSLPENNHR